LSRAESYETGRSGEELACGYLERHGCAILARNWRVNIGEVDIVAECPAIEHGQARELAFVEVRTRGGRRGLAEESISERKAASMAAAAYAYMDAHNLNPETTPWRIDLLALSVDGAGNSSINWIKGVIEGE
jgi:putative endonuclease